MKEYIKRSISLLLIVSIAVMGIAGCSPTEEEKKNAKESAVPVNAVDMEALLSSNVTKAETSDKAETVYVEMDANGNVTNTTVSNILKVSGTENIGDYTKLTDIVNISGDEQFAEKGNGEIIWENHGQNIKYQGKTTQEPPVKVRVKYYMDGKEMSSDDIAGQSGKAKIEYSYENNAVDKEKKFVPFFILTGIVLDENFSNVEVKDGKVIEQDGKYIVIGYSVPGFKSYLMDHIEGADAILEDFELPETVSITADTKSFATSMAVSIATTRIGDLDLSNALDFSDLQIQMNELQSGSEQLVEGAGKLDVGTGTLKQGTYTLTKGAEQLKDGSKTLHSGSSELLSKYNLFNTAILSGSKDLKKGAKQLYDGSVTLAAGAKSASAGAKELATGLKSAKAAFEDTTKSQGLVNGSKTLSAGITEAKGGVNQLVQMLSNTPDTIQVQIDGVITQVSQATSGAIGSEAALIQTMQGIETAVKGGTPLEAVLASMGLNSNTYYSLLQAYYSVQTLENVKSTFEKQITENAQNIQTLQNGLSQLETGATTLSGGIGQLYTGIKQLSAGANTLADEEKGLPALESGAKSLKKGLKSLYNGTNSMNSQLSTNSPKIKSGIKKLDSGASKLQSGSKELADGADQLDNGMVTLVSGVKELKNGMIQLNDEGISRLTELFGEKAPEVVDTLEEVLNRGKNYRSFSGIRDGMSGSVKFIFKTQEITAK